MRRREITLEEKLKYLREIENIHRLSKKVLPPKGTTWARIADKHLKRALGMPIVETAWGSQYPGIRIIRSQVCVIVRRDVPKIERPRSCRLSSRRLSSACTFWNVNQTIVLW